MCFFGNFNVTTPKRRSSQHTHTHKHTHTRTHDWPTVASKGKWFQRSFFGFCKLFLDQINSCLIRRSGAAVFSYKRPVWRHQQESDSTPDEPAPKRRRGPDPAETGIISLCQLRFHLYKRVGHLRKFRFFTLGPPCISIFCLQVRARHILLQTTPLNTILSSQNSEAVLSLPI